MELSSRGERKAMMGASLANIPEPVLSPNDSSGHAGECTELTDGVRTVKLGRGSLHQEVIGVRRLNITDSYNEEKSKDGIPGGTFHERQGNAPFRSWFRKRNYDMRCH